MTAEVLSKTRSAFELAAQFNRQLLQKRVGALEALKSELSLLPANASKEDTRELRQKCRQQLYGILRARPAIERSLRAGRTPFKVPIFKEMNAAQWELVKGPQQLRFLAKSYGLLGTILPYEAEATRHVEFSYGPDVTAKRGNFILPNALMHAPKVQVRDPKEGRLHSVLVLDADVPIEGSNRRHQLGLWGKLNVRAGSAPLLVEPEGSDHWACIPPHPARGSDTHRVVAVVVEHEVPLEASLLEGTHRDVETISEYRGRLTDLQALLASGNVKLLGYQFYRTCWTKLVSQFYSQIGIAEPVFGEVLPSRRPPVSKFLNA